MSENKPIAYDEDARWLLSDGLIFGRLGESNGKRGILLTLEMPGEMPDLLVEVIKKDAGSMTEFCTIARSRYVEHKAEQEAKGARKAHVQADRTPRPSRDTIETPERDTTVHVSDFGSCASRIAEISRRLFDMYAELGELERERDKLSDILEVLSAYEDDAKKLSSVPAAESGRARQGVDSTAREATLQQRGTGYASGSGAEPLEGSLEGSDLLPAPYTDAVDSSED